MLLSPKCVFLNIIVLSCLFESLYNLSQPVGAIELPKSDFFFFFFYCLLMSSSTCFLSFCISCRLATRSRGLNGLRFNPLAILYLMFYSSLEDTIISVWFLLFYDFNCWWGLLWSTYYWRFQNCDVLSFCFHISWNDFINRNLPMCINWLLIHIE